MKIPSSLFRSFFPTAFLVLITTPLTHAAPSAPEPEPRRPAVELTWRGGLPNFFAKLAAGDTIKVGYLGGSITAANGWRVKSLAWLKGLYPKAKLSEINAAIGGTGSDLGVFRVGHDVLEQRPDLMFVEFAVNDGSADPAQIQQCMEGIVRQTWKANPLTDICFIYTVSEPYLADLEAGQFSRAATAMEGVADHYKIPSIHMGIEVAKQAKAGTLIFKAPKPKDFHAAGQPMVFSEDGVHPFPETGHELYEQAIERSMGLLKGIGAAGPHEMIPPLRADNWEKAKLVAIAPSMIKGGWTKLDPATDSPAKSFQNRVPALWRAEGADATLEFTLHGSNAAVYDLLGPDCGQVIVKVDDKPEKTVPRIDGYCTYHRLGKLPLLAGAADGTHHIKITLSGQAPDKAHILFEKNRPEMEKNLARYQPNRWYVGGLMVIGEVAD